MQFNKSEFARRIGVNPSTLTKWEKEGKLIPEIRTPSGRGYYTESQLDKWDRGNRIAIGYSRVERKEDMGWQDSKLNSLEGYLKKHHYQYKLISDVGSLPGERQGFKELLQQVLDGKVVIILVAREEDLATGVELEMLKQVCEHFGTFIEVKKRKG